MLLLSPGTEDGRPGATPAGNAAAPDIGVAEATAFRDETAQAPPPFQVGASTGPAHPVPPPPRSPAADDPPDFQEGPFEVWQEGPTSFHVRFQLPEFSIDPVGKGLSQITSSGALGALKVKGEPELPAYRADFQLPPGASARLTVLHQQSAAVFSGRLERSPGFVQRGAEASESQASVGVSVFPVRTVRLTNPYQIGSARGVGLVIVPFLYHNQRELLAVRSLDIRIEVVPDASPPRPSRLPAPRRSEVEYAAGTRFINGGTDIQTDETAFTRSAQSDTTFWSQNSLLVVVPDAWINLTDDFVQWKKERGFSVVVSRYPTDTGAGAAALKTHIAAAYAADGISHIILIGDSDDIPIGKVSPNPSDTVYTLLQGDDIYHDAFISRVSVETAEQLTYQLNKFVAYEKFPDTGPEDDWYSEALFVASDEGATKSVFNLDDFEILEEERAKLSGIFTAFDTEYEPTASLERVKTAWNNGKSYILYLGHGEYTSWRTTSFDVDDAYALANGRALPMVVNGSCYNGNFTKSYDSLAEAMMRAGSLEAPAGAIGVVAATTAADWDPPIVLLRTFNDLLMDDSPMGAGGFTFTSIQNAMVFCESLDDDKDDGDAGAIKMMEQMHLLGDCTLGLRSRIPTALTVDHPPAAEAGTPFAVTVLNSNGQAVQQAVVCLTDGGNFQVSAWTDANGQANLLPAPGETFDPGADLTLTVFHRNTIPYQVSVPMQIGELSIYSDARLPVAFTGTAYTFTLLALGGTPPYMWELGDGTPDWLVIDPATGEISGLPPAADTVTFTVTVRDQDATEDSREMTLETGNPVAIDQITLPAGMVGDIYQATLTCSGTFAPFSFRRVAGDLPADVLLSGDGQFSGTPRQSGTYAFTIEASDQEGGTDNRSYDLVIEPSPTITVTSLAHLPAGEVQTNYAFVFTARGGTGSGYSWQVAEGDLPAGVSLSANGHLSGIPEDWGDYSFTVQVQDDGLPAHTGQQAVTLHVDMPVALTTGTLPNARLDFAYDYTLTATGSYTPFVFIRQVPVAGYTHSENISAQLWPPSGPATWIGDEKEWDLAFPFTFNYFGQTYTSCRVGDNGYIILDGPSPDPFWEANETTFANLTMIAPLWNDLLISPAFPDTGIWIESSPEQVKILWCGRDYHENDRQIQTGLILESSGNIRFLYGGISTTNRTVIGLSDGSGNKVVLATHDYTSSNAAELTGWDQHDDVVWNPLPPDANWLTLSPAGELAGTPDQTGTFRVAVQVSDLQGHSDRQTFEIKVIDVHIADSNEDGDVDNQEILQFIADIEAGRYSADMLAEAIAFWQSPPDELAPRTLPPASSENTGLTVVRRLPAPGYIPGHPAVFRYDISANERNSQAFIFGEQIESFTGIEAFPLESGRGIAGEQLPMRQDINGINWLVYPGTGGTYYGRLTPAAGLQGPVPAQAVVQTAGGSENAQGDASWDEAVEEEIVVSLSAGWTAFSHPLVLPDRSVSFAFASQAPLSPVYHWTGSRFGEAAELAPGHGYWVCMEEPGGELRLTGKRETDILGTFPAGWQAIGTFQSMPSTSMGLDCWVWNPAGKAWQKKSQLHNTEPIWIFLPDEQIIDRAFGD